MERDCACGTGTRCTSSSDLFISPPPAHCSRSHPIPPFRQSLSKLKLTQLRRAGAALCCGTRASHCGGFSCCGARALGLQASAAVACGLSSCGSWALERRLNSCGSRAQLLCGMWDLPGPGLEPVSPALAGGFLTTAPPGKSQQYPLLIVGSLRFRN